MKFFKRIASALCVATVAAVPLGAAADETWLDPVEAVRVATEACIYGCPLATMRLNFAQDRMTRSHRLRKGGRE